MAFERLNEYQMVVLEYELERYPDIIPVALKKMRLSSVLELSCQKFSRFFEEVQKAKFQKYAKETNGTE